MGYLNLHFDDSYDSHYTTVAPYLASKGIAGTFAMIPGVHTSSLAAPGSRLNIQRARAIQDVYGQECITHAHTTVDHDNGSLFGSADAYLAGEVSLRKAKSLMLAQGFDPNGADLFAAPPSSPSYGDVTNGSAANNVMARVFKCRRTFGAGFPTAAVSQVEVLPYMNAYHFRTIGWNNSTVVQARDFISRIRMNPLAAGVIVFHDIISGGTNNTNVNINDFKAVIDEIVFQRDNNYQSDLAAGTAGGQLKTSTFGQMIRRELAPTA